MTTTNSTDEPAAVRDALFRCLSSARRRIVLGFLVDQAPGWTSTDAVAEHLASVETETDTAPSRRTEAVHVALTHSTLPALAEAGLVERDRENGTLRLESSPVLENESIRGLLSRIEPLDDHRSDEDLDRVFDALADGRRRAVLSELSRRHDPVSRETLARAIAARDDDSPPAAGQERPRNVLASLVHTHLPVLSDAGLVEYDDDSGFVSYVGHPQVYTRWLEPALQPKTPYVV